MKSQFLYSALAYMTRNPQTENPVCDDFVPNGTFVAIPVAVLALHSVSL